MDGCGSFPLDVCEDMMKMEMFLSSFPKLAPFASGQQLGGGLYLCVCVFMLRRRWQFQVLPLCFSVWSNLLDFH